MGKLHVITGLLLVAALVAVSGCIGSQPTTVTQTTVTPTEHVTTLPTPASTPIKVEIPPILPDPTVKGRTELANLLIGWTKDNKEIGEDMPGLSSSEKTSTQIKQLETGADRFIDNDQAYMKVLDRLSVDPVLADLKENSYQMISYHKKASEHLKSGMSALRNNLYELSMDEVRASKEDLDTSAEYEHRAMTALDRLTD